MGVEARALPAWRLAMLLARTRYRHLWNALRARKRGRPTRLVALLGLVTPVAYVSLFGTALGQVRHHGGPRVELAALSLVAGAIVLASLFAKAASSESAVVGQGENEFFMSRPVALSALVVGRSLAGLVTDLFDALFLLPVLAAASISWSLGAAGVLAAVATSLAVQAGVSALGQALQIGVARWIPARRQRAAAMALGLGSALTMAVLWIAGAGLLRAPQAFVAWLSPRADALLAMPSALLVAPLSALRVGAGDQAAWALLALTAAAAAAVALAGWAARAATRGGWQEGGAPWAEGGHRPAARRPVMTLLRKDLALLVRDRGRLIVLVMMPLIFVGAQVVGAAGWSWSTAQIERVAGLSYSLAAYMAMLGPLGHMQAERRAYWFLLSAPVPMTRLLWEKAKAWSVIVGGTALLSYVTLAAVVPGVTAATVVAFALLVSAGATAAACLAVALGCEAVEVGLAGDGERAALRPGTAFLFFFLAGLFNVVLWSPGVDKLRGLGLFVLLACAYFRDGAARAAVAFDVDELNKLARAVRLSDGVAFALVLFAGRHAAALAAEGQGHAAAAFASLGALMFVAIVAGVYLLRQEPSAARRGLVASLAMALLAGGAGAATVVAWPMVTTVPDHVPAWAFAGGQIVALLAVEIVFRGVVQRALDEALGGAGVARGPWRAFVVLGASVALGGITLADPPLALAGAAVAAVITYASGRWFFGFVARAVVAGALIFVAS